MGSVERIKNVAKRVAKWHKAGHKMVVVPSAMSGETNRLLGLAKDISAQPSPRELDMIAATGEQVSWGCSPSPCRKQALTQSAMRAGKCRSKRIAHSPKPASAKSTVHAC